jgi:tetratricopeptide (TPR) repeat protein
MDKTGTQSMDQKAVRRVLRDWDMLTRLGENPLSDLKIVQARLQEAGYTDTAAGRGLALREQVQAAIDLLKPEAGPPKPQEKRWRAYLILTEQYLNGRNPEFLQEKLYISRGTYFEEQNRAMERLVEVLLRMEEQNRGPQKFQLPASAALHSSAQPPFLAPPRPTHALVGRAGWIETLKQRLLDRNVQPVLAIHGLPGAGKTRIAIELAHDPLVRANYCDGILWAGLGRQPDVLALLGTWAFAVGLPVETITRTDNLLDRAELLHAAIGTRRMLLILDDAWQADAALAFKIGGPNCAYLVTTRHTDIALDFAGKNVMAVHELELKDGCDLLLQMAPRLIEAELEETLALVRSVGGLPLALILMGKYLQKQSYGAQTRRLKDALNRLRAAEERLNLSQTQSPLERNPGIQPEIPLSLKTVIGMSDIALNQAAHQALGQLSLFPPKPNSFSEEAALAVMHTPVEVLDALVDCGLIETIQPDRYTLHQTVADYASLQPRDTEAAWRLLNYYVQFTENHAEDFDLLELEFNNIRAALEIANQSRQYQALIALVSALYAYLEMRGLFQICEQQLSRVNQAVETLGDEEEQAFILHWLGSFAVKRGRFKEALEYLQQSLLLARSVRSNVLDDSRSFTLYGVRSTHSTQSPQTKDTFILYGVQSIRQAAETKIQPAAAPHTFSLYGVRSASLEREIRVRALEGHDLFDLSLASLYMGNFREGRDCVQQSLKIYQELNLHQDEGLALNALGFAFEELCDFQKARETLEQALRVCRESGNDRGAGWAHQNLSMVYLPIGDFRRALEHAQLCLEIYTKIGDRRGLGWQTYHLGRIQRQMGNYPESTRSFQQALTILTEIGDWLGRGFCSLNLGLVKLESDERQAAAGCFEQALQIFQKIDCSIGLFQCQRCMGMLRRKCEDAAGALRSFELALQMARQIHFPRGESATLADLGLVYLELKEHARAFEAGQQALRIAQGIGARPTEARVWLFVGHMWAGRGRLEEAKAAYRQALTLRQNMGQTHLTLEPLAGLAQAAFLQGNIEQAREIARRLLETLGGFKDPLVQQYHLPGIERPDQILKSCYKILGLDETGGSIPVE